MKSFILGIVVTLLIGGWITLAILKIISLKVAILVPVGILLGFIIAILVFDLFWRL